MFRAYAKLVVKTIHESTLLMMRRSRCAVYFQKTLHFLIFAPIIIPMLSIKIGLPQYKKSPPKTQNPRKGLDIPVTDGIILSNSATQQLSNSATQQLSNSATQQLRRKGGLCSDKRAAFYATKPYNVGIAF